MMACPIPHVSRVWKNSGSGCGAYLVGDVDNAGQRPDRVAQVKPPSIDVGSPCRALTHDGDGDQRASVDREVEVEQDAGEVVERFHIGARETAKGAQLAGAVAWESCAGP